MRRLNTSGTPIGSRAARVAALMHRNTLAHVSIGAAIAIGAVIGLALGIVVSVTTDVPLAPEAGLVLGALVGWLSCRGAKRSRGGRG